MNWKNARATEPVLVILAAITIFVAARMVLQEGDYRLPLGLAPLLPIALYIGGRYGVEAGILTASLALVISGVLVNYTYDLSTIQTLLIAVGAVVSSLFVATQLLPLKGPDNYLPRIFLASVFLELVLGAMQGTVFRSPESAYHTIANMGIGVLIVYTIGPPKQAHAGTKKE